MDNEYQNRYTIVNNWAHQTGEPSNFYKNFYSPILITLFSEPYVFKP